MQNVRLVSLRSAFVAMTLMMVFGVRALASTTEVILHASDVTTTHGNWTRVSESSAAGGQMMSSIDYGWSSRDAPPATATHYFEIPFAADANTPYHVWFRLRAAGNSKWHDSVWAQYSDALDDAARPIYRIGTGSALAVNLEPCFACGDSGWGWQDGAYWLTQTTIVRFASNGMHRLRIQIREDGVQLDQIVLSSSAYLSSRPGAESNDTTIVPDDGGGAASTPYTGTPASIPGTIEAENFDHGGAGIAYADTTPGNLGGAYRETDVDIEPTAAGGYDIGWTEAGEWLKYTVSVAASGTYTVSFRVASRANGGTFHLEMNGANATGTLALPNTGGWQTWQTVSTTVTLTAGVQVARLVIESGSPAGNFDSFTFTSGSTTSTPYLGRAASIPGTIEAEDFDEGGEAVAYHDTTPGNSGGAYRATDVDIEPTAFGGYNVEWTAAGEFLKYSVNVAAPGSYTVQLRVASTGAGRTMHVAFSGNAASAAVSIPNTSGWQNWITVEAPVTLAAGPQVMTVLFDTGGVNLDYIGVATASSGRRTELITATWNVEIDWSESHSRAVVDRLMSLTPRPAVLLVQEAYQPHFELFLEQLRRRTGQTWYGVFQTHCAPSAWSGSTCFWNDPEGVGIFSSFPIADSSARFLPYADAWHSARGAVRAAIDVGGTIVQVFNVHLQPDNARARYSSLQAFRSWASDYAGPQLIGGDFNAGPDQVGSGEGLGDAFFDIWPLAGTGTADTAFTPSPSIQIDMWYTDRSLTARPLAVYVATSTGTVSDHFPVVATFEIRR